MPFITTSGLTESETSKTVQAGGMTVHYHDIGTGEPVLFLHSYGPGTTAWVTFHKVVDALSRHFRCILMDLPNFSKTGPIVYKEGVHAVQTIGPVLLKRSEEHTSELQSRLHLVCRLLLEKKKHKKKTRNSQLNSIRPYTCTTRFPLVFGPPI